MFYISMTGNPSSTKSKFQTKSASTAHSDMVAVRFVYRNRELEKKKAPKMQTLGLEPVTKEGQPGPSWHAGAET